MHPFFCFFCKRRLRLGLALCDRRYKLHRCTFESCHNGQRYFLHVFNVVGITARHRTRRRLTNLISAETYFEYSSENVHSMHEFNHTSHTLETKTTRQHTTDRNKHLYLLATHMYIDQRPLHETGCESDSQETFHRTGGTKAKSSMKQE